MVIDLDHASFRGLGDAVLMTWLAEGAKDGPDPISFRCSDGPKRQLLEIFGQTIGRGEVENCSIPFTAELADGGALPRTSYLQKYLKIETPLKRPSIILDRESTNFARGIRRRLLNRRMVVVFPRSRHKVREWPAAYFLDLITKLRREGFGVVTITEDRDERFVGARSNLTMGQLVAITKEADIVVGNDSLPTHLGGTVGTPTIALMGPTKPTVFAHCPDVECMQGSGLSCIGCHFDRHAGYRRSCREQCAGFFSLTPDSVAQRIIDRASSIVH